MAKRAPARTNVKDTHELEHLQDDWKWFTTLGMVLIILGIIAVIYCFFASQAAVVLFGILILAGGIAQIISAFWAGKWNEQFPDWGRFFCYDRTGAVAVAAVGAIL